MFIHVRTFHDFKKINLTLKIWAQTSSSEYYNQLPSHNLLAIIHETHLAFDF